MTPRRSLAQLLLNWSLLMLGLITCGLGYLLLQLQLEQFSSNWEPVSYTHLTLPTIYSV